MLRHLLNSVRIRLSPLKKTAKHGSRKTPVDIRFAGVLGTTVKIGAGVLILGTGGIVAKDYTVYRLMKSRGEEVQSVNPLSSHDFVSGLHQNEAEVVQHYVTDTSDKETRPLLVSGSHHVGKSTAIIEALKGCGVSVSKDANGKILIMLDLKQRTDVELRKRISGFLAAAVYVSDAGMDALYPVLSSSFDEFYASVSGSFSRYGPRPIGSLLSRLMEPRPVRIVDMLDKALELLNTRDNVVVWISDAQNLRLIQESENRKDDLMEVVLERFKTGKSSSKHPKFKLIIEISDFHAALAMVGHYDPLFRRLHISYNGEIDLSQQGKMTNRYFNGNLALVKDLAPKLCKHTGDWHSAATIFRECSSDPSVSATSILSRIQRDGHSAIVRARDAARHLDDDGLLHRHVNMKYSELFDSFKPDSHGNAVVSKVDQWTTRVARADSHGVPISYRDLFSDPALFLLVKEGVVIFEECNDHDGRGELKFERPSIHMAARSSSAMWSGSYIASPT